MSEMAKQYDGPHKIILNRTTSNQGIGGHINEVAALASGRFLVVGAGDDISLPNRTATLVKAWQDSGRTFKSIFSDCYRMKLDGTTYGRRVHPTPQILDDTQSFLKNAGYVIGATHGWDREIFDQFGPIDPQIVNEDRVLPLRSLLLGKIGYVKEPLVKYRDGGISHSHPQLSGKEYLYTTRPVFHQRHARDYAQNRKDLIKRGASQNLVKIARMKEQSYQFVCDLATGRSKIASAIRAMRAGVPVRRIASEIIKYTFARTYMRHVDRKCQKTIAD